MRCWLSAGAGATISGLEWRESECLPAATPIQGGPGCDIRLGHMAEEGCEAGTAPASAAKKADTEQIERIHAGEGISSAQAAADGEQESLPAADEHVVKREEAIRQDAHGSYDYLDGQNDGSGHGLAHQQSPPSGNPSCHEGQPDALQGGVRDAGVMDMHEDMPSSPSDLHLKPRPLSAATHRPRPRQWRRRLRRLVAESPEELEEKFDGSKTHGFADAHAQGAPQNQGPMALSLTLLDGVRASTVPNEDVQRLSQGREEASALKQGLMRGTPECMALSPCPSPLADRCGMPGTARTGLSILAEMILGQGMAAPAAKNASAPAVADTSQPCHLPATRALPISLKRQKASRAESLSGKRSLSDSNIENAPLPAKRARTDNQPNPSTVWAGVVKEVWASCKAQSSAEAAKVPLRRTVTSPVRRQIPQTRSRTRLVLMSVPNRMETDHTRKATRTTAPFRPQLSRAVVQPSQSLTNAAPLQSAQASQQLACEAPFKQKSTKAYPGPRVLPAGLAMQQGGQGGKVQAAPCNLVAGVVSLRDYVSRVVRLLAVSIDQNTRITRSAGA